MTRKQHPQLESLLELYLILVQNAQSSYLLPGQLNALYVGKTACLLKL